MKFGNIKEILIYINDFALKIQLFFIGNTTRMIIDNVF